MVVALPSLFNVALSIMLHQWLSRFARFSRLYVFRNDQRAKSAEGKRSPFQLCRPKAEAEPTLVQEF